MHFPRTLLLFTQVWLSWAVFSEEGCGREKSCWFQPPNCAENNIEKCLGSVQWTVYHDGVLLQLEAVTTDLDPTAGHYVALGFSKDTYMGDDTVVECVVGADGVGKAYISFNDGTTNTQLLQTTSVMLTETSSFVEDGHLVCNMKWMFDSRDDVNITDQFKVFDLESQNWHLFFVRGNADRWSLQKQIHSTNDDAQFPWTSLQTVEFCRENCTSDPFVQITEMRQAAVSRYWKYRFAIIHASFMLIAWWVLGSSAILLARFFKPVWPKRKLLGTAVWFQLHRDIAVLAVVLHAVAIFLIIYQAGRLFECTYACDLNAWSLKMHTITGLAATVLALVQPCIALIRPGPNSPSRNIFNWVHWFIGMTAWTFAATAMVLGCRLGKTGLTLGFGNLPTWIMASYIVAFLLCSIALEILSSHSERRIEKLGPTGMALSVMNGPSTESPVAKSVRATARLSVFFVHLLIALAVAVVIIILLLTQLYSHSP